MQIQVPEFSLVFMIGPSGSGKSTFAAKHFHPTEIVSSDHYRAVAADDPNSRKASQDAFNLVHQIADTRLKNRRLTVVDATNLQAQHRKPLIDIARRHDCPVTAVVMNTPIQDCLDRNQSRTDRTVPEHTIRQQHRRLRQTIRNLQKEGVRRHHVLQGEQEANAVTTVERTKLRLDRRDLSGPFDIIGDVHGCYDELIALLDQLGYDTAAPVPVHPEGRMPIYLGDLVDRGPASDRVLELAMNMVQEEAALCIAGNHENKLMRALKGNPIEITHGIQETLDQLEARTPEFRQQVLEFISKLSEHYILDEGRLAVAHAGVPERYQGRVSRRVRDFCLYGQVNGEKDEWGRPVRLEWALEYQGDAAVVYGHIPVDKPKWTNETICVDTGCVFGGSLTALRYPERELVSVPARRTYYEDPRPPAQQEQRETSPPASNPQAITLQDVTGRQTITTETMGRINVSDHQAAAALEIMSRFSVDPRWAVYLPPTISPSETSNLPDFLEHPAQAFNQYRQDGLQAVICEEKHMGSRAIVVLCRDRNTARDRFGIDDPNAGACYSRTGRQFFTNPAMETAFLDRSRAAVASAGLWDELETAWLVVDCEIMPWSLKAQGLLRHTYAPTGAAAVNTLRAANTLIEEASRRGIDTQELANITNQRLAAATQYCDAYRQYCWPADSLDDVKAAPFHIMAKEGEVLTGRPHTWHLTTADRLAEADPALFQKTAGVIVDLADPKSEENATKWWTELTTKGGEGMVVKPLDFIPEGKRDHIQPAVKVRGPHYLRIIYGPEYDLPENLRRLKRRALHTKRNMALREFALGLEGLRRFVEHEPLQRVHQCAFAVLALETEPVDPRL